ncbi:MAG TPA: hypothetical protein VFH27_13925 [Longimicrobiaceae bacterium]|nr:hypothetical protein [Longimicrobiaceae bacterium]
MTLDPAPPGLEPFVRAVVQQLCASTGAYGQPEEGAAEARVERAARGFVDRAMSGEPPAELGAGLADDVPLLAAFFQNVDLLYEHGYAQADAVSGLIMAALERLEAAGGS